MNHKFLNEQKNYRFLKLLNNTMIEKSGNYPLSTLKQFLSYALFALSLAGITPAQALTFNSDFENGTTAGWTRQDGNLPGAITVQSNTVRAGKYAVKLHMKRCSWFEPKCGPSPVGLNKPRAQLGNGGRIRFAVNKTHWMGFSVFVPNNWVFDDASHDSLINTHETNRSNGPGTCNVSPQPLGFGIKGNQWMFRHTNNVGNGAVLKLIAPVERGRWTDFVVTWKWSAGNDGFYKIWKNGNVVWTFNGDTVCLGKDRSGAKDTLPFLNAPIYKATWKHSPHIKERTAYYDEIRVGGSSSSYRDVAPHGAARAVDNDTSVATTTTSAQRKPVAKKKNLKARKKKKKINIKICNKKKNKTKCRRRVTRHNKSIK